jgi:hypothetical protein
MPAAAHHAYIFQRIFGWIVGKFAASNVAKTVPDLSYFLPALFVTRPAFSARPAVDAWSFATVSAWRRTLAARLKSVAVNAVPKVRKGRRRRAVAPAGKAIPKKMPCTLKRYKQAAVSSAGATWRRPGSQVRPRPADVICLSTGFRSARRELAVAMHERMAA